MPDSHSQILDTSLETNSLRAWIVRQGLAGLPLERMFQEFCERLYAAGFPLARANMGIGTLHPRYGSYSFVWRPGGDAVVPQAWEHEASQQQLYQASPINYIRRTGQLRLRRRIEREDQRDFPILEELGREGMTDYAAIAVPFEAPEQSPDTQGIFFSCATSRPGGFDDRQLLEVEHLLPLLALAMKSRATYDVAHGVLETYLGRDAGHRVLRGQIRRGSGETIRAVLWHCDLRDFTALAGTVSREELVELLDDYLECLAGPVHELGGQVLKFLGDGFLATFELGRIAEASVCRTSLAAATRARTELARLNVQRRRAGRPVLGFGLALHLGDVLYGNIGASDRLDFTVIGPAVNEVSRIQELCRPLEVDLLLSKTFFDVACECHGQLVSLGHHSLRGVREPQELFTLR